MSNRIGQAVASWRSRHVDPTSFWLHMVGIPACFVVAPVLAVLRQWPVAGGMFAVGYALQFIGHVIEGNRSGEEMLIRRLLGRRQSNGAASLDSTEVADQAKADH